MDQLRLQRRALPPTVFATWLRSSADRNPTPLLEVSRRDCAVPPRLVTFSVAPYFSCAPTSFPCRPSSFLSKSCPLLSWNSGPSVLKSSSSALPSTSKNLFPPLALALSIRPAPRASPRFVGHRPDHQSVSLL